MGFMNSESLDELLSIAERQARAFQNVSLWDASEVEFEEQERTQRVQYRTRNGCFPNDRSGGVA